MNTSTVLEYSTPILIEYSQWLSTAVGDSDCGKDDTWDCGVNDAD